MWLSYLKAAGKKLDKVTFDKVISEINDEFCQKIIDIVMKLSDIKTAVHVEKSNAVNSTVELFSGSSFCIGADANFLMGKNLWERKNVRSIMIDGMIESVGEIHHLLEKATETKEPYVIFARDMSPDVLHTLYVNIQRRTIDVLPVCVGLDENTINILNDIAIACGGDIVSSYKGDLITSAVKDELPISDFISVSSKTVIIRNDKTKKDVAAHMRYLEKKRNYQREAALRVVFDDRLKAMCSNKIVVSVGTAARFRNRSTIENLDKFYRMCQPLLRYGFLKTDELEILYSQHQKYSNIIYENLVKSGEIISTLGTCIAVKNALSSVKSICSVGYALVEDS
jgi:chaperonin GroEL (HSP60 family)